MNTSYIGKLLTTQSSWLLVVPSSRIPTSERECDGPCKIGIEVVLLTRTQPSHSQWNRFPR